MRNWLGLGGVVASVLATACSPAEHPPVLDSNGSRPGNVSGGGKSSVATGDAGSGNDSRGEGGHGDDASMGEGGHGETPIIPLPAGDSFGFAPDRAYMNGLLEEGTGDTALCDVLDANRYTTAIPFGAHTLTVFRKHVYYLDFELGIRVFAPDYVGSKPWDFSYDYPTDPELNDPVVPTPKCAKGELQTFLVSPDDKHLVYQCKDDSWYEDDVLVYDGPERHNLAGLGYDGLFLLGLGTQLGTMSIRDVQRHTQEKAHDGVLAVRAQPGGFTYAVWGNDDRPVLWEMDAEANPTQLGVYPPPPHGVTITTVGVHVLLRDGTLYQVGTLEDRSKDVIIRRRPDADDGDIVYNEASDPLVRVSFSSMFSSP
jgi:hypothetical protein